MGQFRKFTKEGKGNSGTENVIPQLQNSLMGLIAEQIKQEKELFNLKAG